MENSQFLKEFEELSEKRQRLLDSIEENEAQGLLTQLTEIYPDEAHFIFELLQNAEDAEASECEFYLHANGLRFRHNGRIHFNIDHIKSITNYGQSTKKVTENKIGKFGVGFKSVFSYTSMPIINSEGLTFSISQAILPKTAVVSSEVEKLFRKDLTTFIFDFNEPSKSPQKAFLEISQGLEDLDERSLLFLTNIKRIAISYAKDHKPKKEIIRNEVKANLFRFDVKNGEKEQKRTYMVLRGNMPNLAQNSLDESARQNIQKMKIAIAFRVKIESDNFEIEPIDDANVCVYFPAIKERSGLKFHIHAPFASTPSRDVIRNSEENRTILRGISELLISNMDNLREQGFLSEGLLASFPSGNDQLGSMYEHFREDLISKFKDGTPLIPGSNGEFLKFKGAVLASLIYQKAISKQLLGVLLDGDYSYALNCKNGRAQSFLSSLKPKTLGINELKFLLRNFATGNHVKLLQDALSELSDVEHRNFLSLFSQGATASLSELQELPFLLLNREKVSFGRPSETFLPSKSFKDGENLISRNIVNFEKKEIGPEDKLVIQGLQNLGVRILDDWAMLDLNISKIAMLHRFGDPVDESQIPESLANLDVLSRAIGNDSERIKRITSLNIFIGVMANGSKIWTSLDKTFIDTPYEITGLSSVRGHLPSDHQTELWNGYLEVKNFESLIQSSKSLRVLHPSKVSYSDSSFDWKIDNFEEMLESGDEQFLLNVWDLITDSGNERFSWEKKAERSGTGFRYVDSSFASAMQYSAWLPDMNGKKLRPTLVSRETLNSKFRFVETKLVTAIKFDGSSREAIQRERHLAIQREEKNKLAKELGFKDISEVEALQKLKNAQPELVANLINSMENHFPEELVDDFEQKILDTTKTLGSASEVKIVEGIIRERKNYKETHSEMKEYVRNKYYVGDVMKCQVCSLIMPFKLFSGLYYFEAVFFIKNLDREFKANGLALCPICAARFKYTLQTTPSELRDLIVNSKIFGTGSSAIKIRMSGNDCELSFTDDHLLELQTIFKSVKI
jgi:hypothetical protein